MIKKSEFEARKLIEDWTHDYRIPLDPQDDDYWALVRQFAPELQKQYELIEACKLMLQAAGGSHHWNGETQKALEAIEAALKECKVYVPCPGCAEFRKTVNS